MAVLSVQSLVNAGTAPTFSAPTTSDTARYGNGLNTFLVYKNTDSSTHTVTIVVPGNNSYGQPNPDPTYTVAATTGQVWIPLRRDYDDGNSTASATVTLDAVTGVTVALVRLS